MHGLYLLWWVQEKQLSAASVAAILAAGDVALMLLEVPTGWFADRYGHRSSLILGSLAQVLGMMCCWLGRGIPGLLAASVLVALGDAFRSGADQALLYRTCLHLGRESDFQTIEARTRAAQLASIQAALTGQVAATSGSATTQRMIIQAAAGFQKTQVGADVARNIRDTNIGASLEVGNIVTGAKRDLYMNAGNQGNHQANHFRERRQEVA